MPLARQHQPHQRVGDVIHRGLRYLYDAGISKRQRVGHDLEARRQPPGVFTVDLKMHVAASIRLAPARSVCTPAHGLHAPHANAEHVPQVAQRIRSFEQHDLEIVA